MGATAEAIVRSGRGTQRAQAQSTVETKMARKSSKRELKARKVDVNGITNADVEFGGYAKPLYAVAMPGCSIVPCFDYDEVTGKYCIANGRYAILDDKDLSMVEVCPINDDDFETRRRAQLYSAAPLLANALAPMYRAFRGCRGLAGEELEALIAAVDAMVKVDTKSLALALLRDGVVDAIKTIAKMPRRKLEAIELAEQALNAAGLDTVIAEELRDAGFVRNKHAGTVHTYDDDTGDLIECVDVGAGEGFIRKEGGRWRLYSREGAMKRLVEIQAEEATAKRSAKAKARAKLSIVKAA